MATRLELELQEKMQATAEQIKKTKEKIVYTVINMNKDVIASGEDVSGIVFTRDYYSSSYSNGDLERK